MTSKAVLRLMMIGQAQIEKAKLISKSATKGVA